MKAITLFSSAGIGDLAIKASEIDILVANELLEDRVSLHRRNFPNTKMIGGDIWSKKNEIIETTLKLLNGEELDFLFATPPCQGMSKNGQGKLLNGIRNGTKPKFDERNQLIIPTLDIAVALQPKIILFENVPEMENTFILDENENPINLIEYVRRRLGSTYAGQAEVVQFADFGVPQRRSRLITVFSRLEHVQEYLYAHNTLIPPRTHAKNPSQGVLPWVSVRDTIGKLPKLDAKNKKTATSEIPFHRVPVLDETKYWWIENTPPERGAFDNQCVNSNCGFKENILHGATRTEDGINRANKTTPLYCEKCGSLLPRPSTKDKETGELRIMAGYTSAYKRMSWDLPSSTLTTNLSFACSDQKVHPEQNRVLSLYEAFLLHTLDEFPYVWEHENGKPARDTTVREVIGESIPPKAIYVIVQHLLGCLRKETPLTTTSLLSLMR